MRQGLREVRFDDNAPSSSARMMASVLSCGLTRALHARATCRTRTAMLKRAAMRAGAQMNDFLSNEQRPSVCKRLLDYALANMSAMT